MKLTTKTEYALLALTYMARNDKQENISTKQIAIAQSIPVKFLEQIMLSLKRAGIITSVKGQNGGSRLAKAPKEITLADVVRLFDGALAPTECVSERFYRKTPLGREEKLVSVFKEIRNYIAYSLEHKTLADVI
jgi:Rrf2 family transcriptional regulator, cysteine metabolism repressor